MKNLAEILPSSESFQIFGSPDKNIAGFEFDSRKIKKDFVFVAKSGTTTDGHLYIQQAVELGATIVLCQQKPKEANDLICYIVTEYIDQVLSKMLNTFYDFPAQSLKLIGITGTNGKTTTTTLLFDLYRKLGYHTGLISTIENRIDEEVIPTIHTTPDMIALYQLLSNMVKAHCSHVFMEVSSHAVEQNRIAGLNFTGAVFTNITHDHLDYHGTFKKYIEAKKKFFDNLNPKAFALYNLDDANGMVMVQNTKAKKYSFGLKNIADFNCRILENSFSGLHLKYKNKEWYSRLIGVFNAYNLTTALAVANLLGENEDEVMVNLSAIPPVKGRFEWFKANSSNKIAVVDYAHTPDAVEKILQNIISLKKENQKIITVIGCGGNRDKSKRPEMARIAAKYSQHLVLTSDNPRNENPEEILDDMEMGLLENDKMNMLRIVDRKEAIKVACKIASNEDVILVAGKGHENYQEINGQKYPFDDKEIIKTFLL